MVYDPLQTVRAAFINIPGVRIELLEPSAPNSPVSPIAVKNPAGYHHICFEVDNLGQQLERCRAKRQVIVSPPNPAVLFNGRRITFVLGRDMLLWELLEANKADNKKL